MKHQDMLNRARANGVLVAESAVFSSEIEKLEQKAEPFIQGIRRGELSLKEITSWLRAGRSKQLSEWQAEEVAQYIESEVQA